VGTNLIGVPAPGYSASHRSRLRIVLLLIGVPCVVVVLAVLALFVYWWIELAGPSSSYIAHFDAAQVAAQAKKTQRGLEGLLDRVPMSAQGFSLVASSYADGCYPYNDDTYANWQKVCYGRAVYFYASEAPVSVTEDKVVSVLTRVGWKPSVRNLLDRPCYGYPLDVLANVQLRFVPDYLVAGLGTRCPYSLSETAGDTVAEYAQSSVQYSHLTRMVNEEALEHRLALAGYQSFVMISVEKQYFDKPVGLYIFG